MTEMVQSNWFPLKTYYPLQVEGGHSRDSSLFVAGFRMVYWLSVGGLTSSTWSTPSACANS